MRFPKMTTRRWMVVVVVVAAVAWSIRLHRLSVQFREKAVFNGQRETYWLERVEISTKLITIGERIVARRGDSPEEAGLPSREGLRGHAAYRERATRIAESYARLRRKYEHAARYPWLPVAPDPPEPSDGARPCDFPG